MFNTFRDTKIVNFVFGDRAESRTQKAEVFFRKGDFQKAASITKNINADYEEGRMLNTLSNMLLIAIYSYREKDYQTTIAVLRIAKEIDLKYPEKKYLINNERRCLLHVIEIHSLVELEQFDKALEVVKKAKEIDLQYPQKEYFFDEPIYHGLIIIKTHSLRVLKQFDDALKDVQSALKSSKLSDTDRASLLNIHGHIYLDQAMFEEALECFNKAIFIDKHKTFVFVGNKVSSLQYLKCYREAHLELDTWIENHSENSEVFETKASLYYCEHKFDQALEWIEKANLEGNCQNYHFLKIDSLRLLGRDEEAMKMIEETLENDVSIATKISLLNEKATLLLKQGLSNQVLEVLDECLVLVKIEKINRTYEIMYANKAFCFLLMGRYKEAHLCINDALKLNEESCHIQQTRGLIFLSEGDYQAAAQSFKLACEIKTTGPINHTYKLYPSKSYCYYAFSLILLSEFTHAHILINQALALTYPSIDASIQLGFIALLNNEQFNAEQHFSNAESIMNSGTLPDDMGKVDAQPLLKLGLGLLAHRQGNYEVAKEKLKTPEICLKSVWYYHLKGLCFMACHDYLEANKVFEEGVLQTDSNEILERCLCDVQVAIDNGESVRLVSDKDREIVSLQQLSDKAMEKLEVSEQKREDSEETKKALQQALDRTINEKETLEKERAHFNEKATVLQKRIKTLEQQNAQMETIKEENRSLSKENKSLREEKKTLIDETTKINQTVMRLEETIKSKDVLIEELKEKIDKQVSNFEKYKQESEKRFSKLENNQAKQKAKQKEKQKAKSDGNDGIRQKITDLFSVHETKKPENKLPIEMEEKRGNSQKAGAGF